MKSDKKHDFFKLSGKSLENVSGGYIGVDRSVEDEYNRLLEKAWDAYEQGEPIFKVFSEQEWEKLAVFYEQISSSKKPYYDPLQELMEQQANEF